MRSTNKHIVRGPGGLSCPCCFPAPGTKQRAYKVKQALRKWVRDALKLQDKAE